MSTKKYQADFMDNKLTGIKQSYRKFTGFTVEAKTKGMSKEITRIFFEIDSKEIPLKGLKAALRGIRPKPDLG